MSNLAILQEKEKEYQELLAEYNKVISRNITNPEIRSKTLRESFLLQREISNLNEQIEKEIMTMLSSNGYFKIIKK